jgi:hypothetical protein
LEDTALLQEIGPEMSRRKAFDGLIKALRPDARLPSNVFAESWSSYLFFPSDELFLGEFVSAVSGLLLAEKGSVACLINLSETTQMTFDKASAIFLDNRTTASWYDLKLRGNGPADGSIFVMDRYACMSDVGEWCIYCEKEEDVAVIAVRDTDGVTKFDSPLAAMRAAPLSQLSVPDTGVFPFNKLTPNWHKELTCNYKSQS